MQVGVGQLGGAGDQRDVAAQVFGFAYANGQGAGGFDGGDAGSGVFNADAAADVRAHALGGGEEDVRGGFGMRDGGWVGNGVEEVGQPHAFEQERAVFTGGREGDFFAVCFQCFQQRQNAGIHVFGFDCLNHLQVVVVFAAGQFGELGFADGFAAVREDAFERIVARHAFELLVKLAIDADAQFFGELFPCAVVVFGGIGDDTVEVKKHCGESHFASSLFV